MSYKEAFTANIKEHGIKVMYKGVEARIGVLIVVNFFNEFLLKKIWEKDNKH